MENYLTTRIENGDNQMNTVHLNKALSGLHRRVRLGMHCKVQKIVVDLMSISPDNPV